METKTKCDHKDKYIAYMPKGYIHYAMLKCEDCDKYIKWVPFPHGKDIKTTVKQTKTKIIMYY